MLVFVKYNLIRQDLCLINQKPQAQTLNQYYFFFLLLKIFKNFKIDIFFLFISLLLALKEMTISNSFTASSVFLKTFVFFIISYAPTEVTFVL